MNSDLYALIALAARYWFVALIVALLFRGWRMTVADNRRAKLLREWMGQTGCVGELILNPGSKKRVSHPIPREGVLGSGFSADVRIRHRDVERAHAHFELREGGLLMKPLGRASLSVGGGFTGEAVFLQDGDVLTIGKLQLMLVLFDAPMEEEEADEWFDVASEPEDGEADEPYERRPVSHARPMDDEDEWAERPARRARHLPEAAGKAPVAKSARRVRNPQDAVHEAPGAKPARRARNVPVSLEGQFAPAPMTLPREKRAKRGRSAAAEIELPFDPRPVRGRRTPPNGGEARGSGAAKAKGGRTRPAAPHDDFSEDTIWPDL